MLSELIKGYVLLIVYFIIGALSALILRRFISMPKEVFRKILHIILLGSVFILTYAFTTWLISAIASIVFIIMVYPILSLGEHHTDFSKLLIQRRSGEIKKSLIVAFGMFSLLICICWGWLDKKFLIIAAVLAWGTGDAMAALVGKHFGKHIVKGKLVEGKKTLEGTFAMFITSFVAVLLVLLGAKAVVWYAYIPIAVVTAAIVALVELYTKGGMDTLTCPLAAVAVLIPLIKLWGI